MMKLPFFTSCPGPLLAKILFSDRAEIRILNVISTSFSFNVPEIFYPEINEGMVEIETEASEMELTNTNRIIKEAEEYLTKSFKTVEAVNEVGDSSTEIFRTAERLGTDLIAVGCRDLTGYKGMMGTVSRNALTHARCFVLIGTMCRDWTSVRR